MNTHDLPGMIAAAYGSPPDRTWRAPLLVGALLAGWLLGSTALADGDLYSGSATGPIPLVAVAAAGLVAVLLVGSRLAAFDRLLTGPGAAARLIALQSFRVVGGVFLVVLALGELPPLFALPAGIGDVLVGISAPFVARRLARDGQGARTRALWFNGLGLLDLAVAMILGALTAPSVLPQLPLALIPTFAVPVAVVLHVLSIRAGRGAEGKADDRLPDPRRGRI
jgi:hypothetical protein